MATLFQSFRSSSMPKRLLRYALSRLELLDAETLDMENLDFALGKNTLFEFRDVRIKLKKLEKLLKLPAAFKLQRAKVLLLRITIPMDFYTSPITIEIDGVDVRLQVLSTEPRADRTPAPSTPDESTVVPNTVDLAQSFLDAQPKSERQQLEEALAAETQDLGASVSVSDDGSEDETTFGTGQTLSLPAFLADFLQGIVDRVQIKIKGVTFQLDMEVPVDATSSNLEPVSFQIALEGINVEGVTVDAQDEDGAPSIIPKEGKRHVSLTEVRAYLISEANVLSTLVQSPSVASPSFASSPLSTRNPPSREATWQSQGSFRGQGITQAYGSLREHLPDPDDLFEPDYPLADSEEALAIPYDLSDEEQGDDGSPATPRASMYHDFSSPPEDSMFHSTRFGEASAVRSADHSQELPHPARIDSGSRSSLLPTAEVAPSGGEMSDTSMLRGTSTHSRDREITVAPPVEDLAQSHLYTHEDAESMYMSAFSQAHSQALSEPPETDLPQAPPRQPNTPRSAMPGSWDEDSEDSPPPKSDQAGPKPEPVPNDALPADPADSGVKEPTQVSEESSGEISSFGTEQPQDEEQPKDEEKPKDEEQPEDDMPPDDIATPKGPTRLAKEILKLKNVSVYIPSQHQHIHVRPSSPGSVAQLSQSLGRSTFPQAPGAFSVHGQMPDLLRDAPSSASRSMDVDHTLEIILSPISVSCDASLGYLLAMVVGKLLEAVKDKTTARPTASTSKNGPPKTSDVKVTLQELSINFISRLSGVADTSERYLDPAAFDFDQDVLLNANLQNLTVSVSQSENISKTGGKDGPHKELGTVTKVELQKFRFGYANDDILTFDNGRQMSTSVRDSFLSSGYDIGIKTTQTRDNFRTEVETLPLVLNVDLQRLDETFTWFGGLSGFLNMSTSMASNPSPVLKSDPLITQKPRGVRFQTPIDPTDKSAAAANKVNVRIGGVLLELLGKECSVVTETSAVKIVSRDEGIGVACSLMRISGPYLVNSVAEPAIVTKIDGLRLDYLMTPNDADLERLLELIMPSKVKFDHENDEIMVDTLLRQRRKGSVLRSSVERVTIRAKNLAQLSVLPNLAEEISKLSTVAKYLPEDDRPGLLTLGRIQKVTMMLNFDGKLGRFDGDITQLDIGHISVPSLLAISSHGISVKRNGKEELLSCSTFKDRDVLSKGPVIMVRMIGDEIDPVIKLKLQDLSVEYRVPVIMDILGLGDDATPQDFESSLAASVANLGDQAHTALARQPPSPVSKTKPTKPMTLDVGFRDCLLGLNPLNLNSKMTIAFTDAHLSVVLPKDVEMKATFDISKASILLIDDVSQIGSDKPAGTSRRQSSSSASRQVVDLCAQGYVDISYISSAKAVLNITPGANGEKQVEVDVRDDLLVLETCADSTQTLVTLANALKPPTPPSKENKYRTKVMPVQDLLASISAEAFGRPEGEYDFDQDFAGAQEMAGSSSDIGSASDDSLRIESQFYEDEGEGEELFDATRSSGISDAASMQDTGEGVLLTGFPRASGGTSESSDELMIQEDFYGQSSGKAQAAKVWNSNKNTYDAASQELVAQSPLRLSVRDVHIIWNLFDGYDWAHTRDIIGKAVQDIETRAYERQARSGSSHVHEEEVEDEEAIGDFLFNSIYIGIPANRDPQELSRAINAGFNDNATETESVATTALTGTTNRTVRPHHPKSKRLRLHRSKHHKITFELQGVDVDMIAFPAEGSETLSSIDVRVRNLDIFDHVPTSTWKKFATYDQDKGEREMGTSMIHLEILNVKPLPELGASEIVLRATILPLRLHVDQDALDFITRFFEFKDEKVPVHASPSDVPFVQRAEVKDIAVKLDFKPKRVDYAGLRSGHTTEFMNFIVLEEARMVLRHVIIYGVTGFDRLGNTLNDIWMPDVRTNQLPGVIAGLAPVRSLVNIGSGFRDLIEIPLREYQKDGRVMRSISKGAAAFARTTGTEIVKLGAKLAVGTQYALQGAEGMLTEQRQTEADWEEDDIDEEDKKQISLYADQPTGVMQGLRGGYRSLTRDVNLARDAIIAVPGEIMESSSASGAARAVWKKAPTIIFRPAVGVTKAIGQTLMGATNTIDPQNKRRIDEKYKKH